MKRVLLALVVCLFTGLLTNSCKVSIPNKFKNAPSGTTLVINKEYDLEGSTWVVPDNVTIRFRKSGALKNGIIVGSSTKIKANKCCSGLFKNVVIKGTWCVNSIYSRWFVFENNTDNTQQFKNLFGLCSPEVDNSVYISSGFFLLEGCDITTGSISGIKIPSNTHVYSQATIKSIPHSNAQSFLFYYRNVSNCSWEGGRIVGDIQGHLTEVGEQCFGLALRGAKNITIENVEYSGFWGDGINLQYLGNGCHNENVTIDNVRCEGNRRQGISIEDGVNIVVKNSSFENTGNYRGTAPMKGVDIEPCYREAVIQNVLITDCIFENNKGGGVGCSYLKQNDSDVTIKNCTDLSGGLRFNNCRIDDTSKGIEVINYKCPKGKLQFKRKVNNVRVMSSSFMSSLNESVTDTLSNIHFEDVTFSTSEKRTWNYYCLSLVCAKMKDLIFDRCYFEIREGSNLTAVLPSGGDWTGCVIRNSCIVDHRNNKMFIPCDIIGSKIECGEELSFVNCKSDSQLLFKENEINIKNSIDESPFLFHTSINPQYVITDNSFTLSVNVEPEKLKKRYKTNKTDPQVDFHNNTFKRK